MLRSPRVCFFSSAGKVAKFGRVEVLFVLLHLLQFTTQDDSSCTPATTKEVAAQLNQSGGGPLGKFNKNYMAFTWNEVLNNFDNLITQQSGNLSASPPASSSFPSTQFIGDCTASQNSFPYCNACPAVTDLGEDRYPRFINEIICETEQAICGQNADGFCKTTSINQELLMSECDPATGKEKLVPYSQPIRSCCECFLF